MPARWRSTLFSPQSALALLAQTSARVGQLPRFLELVSWVLLSKRSAQLLRYQPTEHDVFAATFAKSGTNWSMQICLQIAHRGAAEYEHIHDLVAWPEGPFKEIVDLEDPGPQRAAPTGMRVIKSHLPAGEVPYDPKARYVTIIRDPKEVLVSSYYFLLGQLGVLDRLSPQEYVEYSLQLDRLPSHWASHTASYWAWRARPNVYLRFFQQLKADLPKAVDEIAALMGVALRPDERAAVLERCSFKYMKERDHAFAPPPSPLVPKDQRPSMMRKGQSGGSRELLTPEQGARLDALCEQALLRRGCDLPYREWFVRDA
ncbi:MAG: sulfotransferase domain-containing protein [Myxococcales bacterium]|nr:sulfotransferase domain-containing protein [Myxococcales bacterium]